MPGSGVATVWGGMGTGMGMGGYRYGCTGPPDSKGGGTRILGTHEANEATVRPMRPQ